MFKSVINKVFKVSTNNNDNRKFKEKKRKIVHKRFCLSFFWVYFISSSHSRRKEDCVSESYQAVADLLQSDLQDRFRWMHEMVVEELLGYVVFVRMSSSFLIMSLISSLQFDCYRF